jgi:hypothetical protein
MKALKDGTIDLSDIELLNDELDHFCGPSGRRRHRRRPAGPRPSSGGRYDAADEKLFPEIDALRRDQNLSPTSAALKLAEAGKVAGTGSPASRAKRLAGLYLRQRVFSDRKLADNKFLELVS